MGKRKNQPLIDSEEESGSNSSASDMDDETPPPTKATAKSKRIPSRSPKNSSDSGSDSDEDTRKTKKPRRMTKDSSDSSGDDDSDADEEELDEQSESVKAVSPPKLQAEDTADKSDLEDGQISDDEEDSSDSEDSEFDDGFDEDFMGDEEDRARLERLSEKERETEIYKRAERRDQLKRRWEIERKIKLSRKAESAKTQTFKKPKPKKPKVAVKKVAHEKQHKPPPPAAAAFTSNTMINDDSTSSSSASSHMFPPTTQPDGEPLNPDQLNEFPEEYFDPKERSKERKKNVEMNKTDDKRTNAMALLKMKREGKQKREEEEAKREAQKKVDDEKEELDGVTGSKSSVKLKASEVYSDDSSSDSEREKRSGDDRRSRSSSRSSSDSDDDQQKSQTTSHTSNKKPIFISTLDEINKLRISRHKLEKFINLPIFEKTVVGCFVRINIGNNNSSQKLVYRVAEITAVLETPKVYLFGNSRTNKGVRLRHGTQERVFRLEFVSNQDFTVTEFDKWKEVCHRYSVVFPQIDLIEQKKKDIQQAMSYEFREEDVNRIIQEKDRFRAHPTNYAMRKTHLMKVFCVEIESLYFILIFTSFKERDAAQLRGEDNLANDITSQIQELEERANELDKRRTSSISLISYINNRNRKMNVEEAEKAIIEEAKANQGKKFSDPFTRRSTKPKMAFKAFAPTDDDDLMMAPEAPKIHKSKEKKQEEHTSADNLYSLHDFEIELDVTLPMNNVPILPKPIEQKTNSGPIKRSLNLEDYKKKRGLI